MVQVENEVTAARRWLLWLGLVAGCLGGALPATRAAEPPRAVHTAEELRRRLDAFHARLRAWYVEYQAAPDAVPGIPPGGYVHRVVAAKYPDSLRHSSAHGTGAYHWRDDPLQQRLTVSPTLAVWEFPFNRSYRSDPLARDAELPGTAQTDFIFVALGWWPFEKRPPPKMGDGHVWMLPDVAKSSKYRVRPLQEMFDGRWCHVLESPGHDRLWLDCQRDATLVARDGLEPKTGDVAERIELTEHRECEPGVWVPTRMRNTVFDVNARTSEGRQRKILDAMLRVLDVRLNDQLAPETFVFKPAPGAVEIAKDSTFTQVVPGGTDHIDALADWMDRLGVFSVRLTPSTRRLAGAVLDYAIMVAAVALMLAVSWHSRRRSRAA